MAKINNNGLLQLTVEAGTTNEHTRVFIPSQEINVFPCSRRGQNDTEINNLKYYDPEARLNTERTNRLHTAVNGFKDSFIIGNSFASGDTLVFVLAGYYIKVKNFDPSAVATAIGTDISAIYAHLRLHSGVSLDTGNYFTEMLFRQSDLDTDANYLDVEYTDEISGNSNYFFVGISFTKDPIDNDDSTVHNLPLFTRTDNNWELVQTSLLPKVEHGTTEDSIKISGDFTISHDDSPELVVTAGVAEFAVPITVTNPTGTAITVDGTTWLKGVAQIDGEATLHNKLLIKSGNTTRAEIDSSKVDLNLPVTVNNDLKVSEKTTVKSLVVGERTEADSAAAGAITAKTSIKTPLLNVTNNYKAQANIDNATITGELKVQNNGAAKITTDALIVGGNSTLRNNLTVEDNINVGNPAEPASANNGGCIVAQYDITAEEDLVAKRDVTAGGSATIAGNVTVGTDNNTSTGTITAKNNITALGSMGTSNDLTVDKQAYVKTGLIVGNDTTSRLPAGEIKAMSKVATPTLAVNEITSESTEIAIAKTLKVGTISSDSTSGLIVKQQLTAEKYLNVGSPLTPTQTTGDIVAKNNIFAENGIVAKNTLKSPAIYQTVSGSDKPVPYIDLVKQSSGQYQLQISRASTVEN